MFESSSGSAPSGVAAVVHHLAGSTLRGALLLALLGLAAWLCGRRSAGLRHLLWAVGLGQLALLTAVGWALPAWRWQVLPGAPFSLLAIGGQASSVATGPAVVEPALAGAASAPVAIASVSSPLPGSVPPGSNWWLWLLFGGWAVGALWLLARTAQGWWEARQLVRAARPAEDPALRALTDRIAGGLGLRTPIDLRVSPAIDTPLAAGLWRSVVLLPATVSSWSADLLESVLTHELAHVRRGDCAVQLLGQVVRALHWMNPLCWLALHRLTVERERACDDLVLESGTRPSRYATHLLEVARQATATGAHAARPAGAMAMFMVRGSALGERLERMLDGGLSHRAPGRRTVMALLGVALLVTAPVACLVGDPGPRGPGLRLTYQTEPAALERTAEVLARRLDLLDLEGARLRKQGAHLMVELPAPLAGQSAENWKQALDRPGTLRLLVVDRTSDYPRRLAVMAGADPRAREAGISAREELVRVPVGQGASYQDHHLHGPHAALETYLAALPPSLSPEAGHRLVLDPDSDEPGMARTQYLDEARQFTITRFADADVELRPEAPGWFYVHIQLDAEDGAALKKLTSANLGERMAVMLDGREMWGAPTIQSPFGERLVVSAKGSKVEAERLAQSFRIGALPAPLELVIEQRLGP